MEEGQRCGGCYPDATGIDWHLGNQSSRTRFFDTDAFIDRNPALGSSFRYGTVHRNSLIGSGITSLDMSIDKKFQRAQ